MDKKYIEKIEEGKIKLERCINILKKEFPEITFLKTREGSEADKEISIDLKAIYNDKEENWAVKFRLPIFKEKFNDITVEYKNGDNSNGDWFRFKNGSVHKYIYGWADGNIEFFIIDVKKMMECDKWSNLIKNSKWGSATFKAITINCLKNNNSILKYFKIEDG